MWKCTNNKIAIYTCIIGNVDLLKEVKNPDSNVDYICFTDRSFKSTLWDIVPVDPSLVDCDPADKVRFSKFYKHLPHCIDRLYQYDYLIYVDGHISIKLSPIIFISLLEEYSLGVFTHNSRDCIYNEAKECIRVKLGEKEKILNQVDFYKSDGMGSNFGLWNTGVQVSQFKDKKLIEFREFLWKEILKWSNRDQLSFAYCVYKINFKLKELGKMWGGEFNKYFSLTSHLSQYESGRICK